MIDWSTPAVSHAAIAFGVLCACMFALWLASLVLRNVSIVDAFWGPGFFVVAGCEAALRGELTTRGTLMLPLVLAWAVRLGLHLHMRGHGAPEDRRYAEMREKHGDAFAVRSLFTVFLLQAVLLFLIASPIQLVMLGPDLPLGLTAFAGAALSLAGIVTEGVADYQLTRFRNDPDNEGKVLSSGLFRYSRHPNYFGNFCIFWGFWLMAAPLPYGLWSALGPALLSVMLMRVSGVSLLEKDISERRPAYREYKERTSAFFPAPPRET